MVSLFAGMPAPLPIDAPTVFRLTDWTVARLQALSFFLFAFLLCAACVRLLWNALRRDFPALPGLSFGRALAGTTLWGLLAVVVLTMISGARELMTPGAWRKSGATYQLADAPPPAPHPDPPADRRRHLERLRTALWQFAATHAGKFPTTDERAALPAELWEVPGGGGLRYIYLPGRSAGYAPDLLLCEPELDPAGRFVLRTNGDILPQTTAEIQPQLRPELGGKP